MDFFFWHKQKMLTLPYRREIHCHLLPGVDDGSQSIEESIECLKALAMMGVERVVLTPHRNRVFQNVTDELAHKYAQLIDACAEEISKDDTKRKGLLLPAIEHLSLEYKMDTSIQDVNEFKPIVGNYVLVENGFTTDYPYVEQTANRILSQGMIPVLAHPERYTYWMQNGIAPFEDLQSMGFLFQCNIVSFAGFYGESSKNVAYSLLEHGLIDFLGSDMHNKHYYMELEEFLKTEDYKYIREDLVQMIINDKI